MGLQGVDDFIVARRQALRRKEQMNVGIAGGVVAHGRRHLRAFRVIVGLAQPQQRQLQAGVRPPRHPVGVNNAPGVFPHIKAGYLRRQGAGRVNAQGGDDLRGALRGHSRILGGQRVNGRRGRARRQTGRQPGRNVIVQ